ncbi:MAG: hypothetical protein GC191_00910 [Azospirillum sp.]|nr:hypothetical protein [Azospirillum sp.]
MVDHANAKVIPLRSAGQPFYAPAFALFVKKGGGAGGTSQKVSFSAVRDIMEVSYEDGVERIDSFTLTVNNWNATTRRPLYFGRQQGDPAPDEPDLFEPGNELMLYMGYQDQMRLMMTGFVTTVDVQFPETGPSKLVVTALNVLDQYRGSQYTWAWPDDGGKSGIRDSDVAAALSEPPNKSTKRPGLGIEVRIDQEAAAKEPMQDVVYMRNQYPIVFLMELARRRGYQVILQEEPSDDQTAASAGGSAPQSKKYLSFGPVASTSPVTYELEWGKSLASFHPTYSNAKQLFSVTVCGWDRKAKKPIEVTKSLDDSQPPNSDLKAPARAAKRTEVITDPPAATIKEAEARALQLLNDVQSRMVEATGATVGLPDLRCGSLVLIKGTGRLFDGQYRVLTTSHTLNDSGYRTSFSARRVKPLDGAASTGKAS